MTLRLNLTLADKHVNNMFEAHGQDGTWTYFIWTGNKILNSLLLKLDSDSVVNIIQMTECGMSVTIVIDSSRE